MIRSGVRRVGRGLKRRIKKLIAGEPRETTWVSAPVGAPAPEPVSPFAAAPAAPAASAASAVPAASTEAPTERVLDDADDTAGPPLTVAQVAELFEDMVRPALQSDGGDIDLVKVEDNDVYVRLTGACSTCPSSTVTMKMGIERLLAEEFPQFRQLIQVP